MNVGLKDKFHGCVAGSYIGSAMGAAVEGLRWQDIEEKHGFLRTLEPYEHYGNGWLRPAGTTEEGVERQKRLAAAIIEKQDRITGEDVMSRWLADDTVEGMRMLSEPFELRALEMARVGVPARDLGGYSDFTGHVAFAAACHPLGLINAGNPDAALEDVLEVGQIYQAANSKGLLWSVVTGVGVAEATRPGASVDSVLGAILDRCDPTWVAKELDRHLQSTAHIGEATELRTYFDGVYGGHGVKYPFSYANEVVTKAVCIFRMSGGKTDEALLTAVNFGRDASSTAAIAAGLAGALTGAASLSLEWQDTVDAAARANPHSSTTSTLAEASLGLYEAFQGRLAKRQTYLNEIAAA